MLSTVLKESVTAKKASEEGANLNIQVHRCKLFCQASLVRTCTCECNSEDRWQALLTSLLIILADDILADDRGHKENLAPKRI